MLTQAAVIVIAVTVILGTLAIVAVGLRVYCRYLQKLPLGLDDYLIVVALFLSTGINVLTDYVAATTGVGDPSYVPTEEAVVFALKSNFAAENAQIAAIGICKVSLLLFYRRIFVMNWFRVCNNILMVLISSFTLAILLSVVFAKWPVYQAWNPEAPFNINIAAVLIAFVALNALFDLLILSLPLAALRKLQIGVQRKLFLSTLFTLGSACVIASLFRLYYGIQYIKVPETPVSFFQVPFIYNSLWANIETPLFIIAGCLLSFGPLFRGVQGPAKYLSSLRSLIRGRGQKSSSSATLEVKENNIWKSVTVNQVRDPGTMDNRAV